ncbi:MAG: xylose isomerase, partial [Pseudomonadota bacterium]|nr:xylose isomerase [Pseudomonadota bacterium]
MTGSYFNLSEPISFEGDKGDGILSFRHYDPNEMVMGKRLADHLRFAVCYWHNFVWPGTDPFGGQTFERPWFGDDMDAARRKADVAFEMFGALGVPYFCFHDFDVRPEGTSFAESRRNLEEITDYFQAKMEATGVRLLWGTANL